MLSVLCTYSPKVSEVKRGKTNIRLRRWEAATHTEAIVLDESESIHETDIYEPSVTSKVILEVAFDCIRRNSSNVKATSRH